MIVNNRKVNRIYRKAEKKSKVYGRGVAIGLALKMRVVLLKFDGWADNG